MEQNGVTGEQEAVQKLEAFKAKLNKESGVNPLDVLNERGQKNSKGRNPSPGGNGNRQKVKVQRQPAPRPQNQQQAAAQRQPGVNPTDLVLGTSLINIFERFGKAFTPSEEAAILTAINDRCPWYLKRLNDIRQQQQRAAQQQQQDRGFEPDPDDTGADDDNLFDDDEDRVEYVPFKDEEDDGSNVG